MRQIIIKKKKKIKVRRRHRLVKRLLSTAAALCILAGMPLDVHGSDKAEENVQTHGEVVTEIFHKHVGNNAEQGGCYSEPVFHQHEGNEKSGGSCYQTPIYHSHAGNENEGGGCYTKSVYHEHLGDELQGGGCYGEITHSHITECYEQADCLMNHAPDGNILETWTDTCFAHGQTAFGKSKGIATHNDCDKGLQERIYSYCLTCGSVSPSLHSYQKLVCQIQEGTVTGYQKNCGKDETTIDGYSTDCGLEEGKIEKYSISCNKTVDGYGTGCGFTENQLCGRLIVRNETEGKAEKAVLSVHLEDLTGGRLNLCIPAYEWKNENGQVLGNGEKIEVNENGRYSVLVRLENKDVDDSGLHSSIFVNNIEKENSGQTSTPGHLPSPSALPESGKESHPTAMPKVPENGGDSSSGESSSNPLEAQVPQIEKSIETAEIMEGIREINKPLARTKKAFIPEKIELSPSPEKTPVIKESQTVAMEEYDARGEEITVNEESKKVRLFNIPAVRMIVISGGVLLLMLALALLFLYFRQSVSVFNDNGQGRMLFLGRCLVKYENDCYGIVISEEMEEKACTNRYCIKPGLFRIGKKEGEELIIKKGNKSITSYLDREMIVML